MNSFSGCLHLIKMCGPGESEGGRVRNLFSWLFKKIHLRLVGTSRLRMIRDMKCPLNALTIGPVLSEPLQ